MFQKRLDNEFKVFLHAVGFLTRFPLPDDIGYTPARMAAAPRYFPLVGALLGLLLGGAFLVAHSVWSSPALAALLSTLLSVILTGGFHEDGLADTCDALGGQVTTERALEIMKDSRLGTYGTLGLGLLTATKVRALSETPIFAIVPLLVLAHTMSRVSALVVIGTSRYVREAGTAKPVAKGLNEAGWAVPAIHSAVCVSAVSFFLDQQAIGFAMAGLVASHLGTRLWFERRLGGYTGDCLGATQQVGEVSIYLGALACL